MDWDAPAIVLDARAYGEGGAIATVFTEANGVFRGLARGGFSRAQSAIWQPGNLVRARWMARLEEQLGVLSAELVHPAAALVMGNGLALAALAASCAVAADALPERAPHPALFRHLAALVAALADSTAGIADLIRWEAALLGDLGFGLDLAACALTGATEELAFVSPRTGRAVARAAAGVWESRLLRLPPLLSDPEDPGTPADWRDGLRLTGHFLARDAFGQRHRGVPQARLMLYDRVAALAAAEESLANAR
ncbi:MAG TPA: DNA repair protein RecO [Acetobacteraceae bacterium]|nr:DNA repair protein RecO [Acetobacteraceae bacterium]